MALGRLKSSGPEVATKAGATGSGGRAFVSEDEDSEDDVEDAD